MLGTTDRERGSIVSTLNTLLALWADEPVTDATSRSGFTFADLARRDHPVSLYVTLPYQDLERLGPLVRKMFAVLTLRVTERPPDTLVYQTVCNFSSYPRGSSSQRVSSPEGEARAGR